MQRPAVQAIAQFFTIPDLTKILTNNTALHLRHTLFHMVLLAVRLLIFQLLVAVSKAASLPVYLIIKVMPTTGEENSFSET